MTMASGGELSGIRPPIMDWSQNDLPSAFREFRLYCELIFKGPLSEKSAEAKVTYILLWIGQEGIRVFESWGLADDHGDRKDPAKIFGRFEQHFEPKTNFRLNRFHLHGYRQSANESIDDFMSRCKLQAKQCKFNDQERSNRLIEQLIVGTRHKKIQEQLLGKDEKLTLDQAMDIARTHEATQSHMTQLHGSHPDTSIHEQFIRQPKGNHGNVVNARTCDFCSRRHPAGRDKCPAYGTVCKTCGQRNHWSRSAKCRPRSERRSDSRQRTGGRDRQRSRSRPRKGNHGNGGKRQFNEVRSNDSKGLDDAFETLSFQSVGVDVIDNDTRDEVFTSIGITLRRKPATLKAKVDTGAQGNLLPLRIFRRMYPELLGADGFPKEGSTTPTHARLSAYNGSKIEQFGTINLQCNYEGNNADAKFYVTDSSGPAIFGLPLCRDLKLVVLNCEVTSKSECDRPIRSKAELKHQYPDRFEGIGKFARKAHITLDPTVPPVVHPPRKCPIQLKDQIRKELDNMESLGVISKVTEPTDWVSSLAYSRKSDGRIRICLDPKDLNSAIKRPHHRSLTLEEITHKLAGATVFSKLDARHGYWSVQLDDESRLLTTFNSPEGRYCFNRLPFGLSHSQDEFAQRMDMILEECNGAIGIADDVTVFGANMEDHNRHLHELMRVARKHGLVFNYDKCEIAQPSIRFFGVVFDAAGVHPDPDKVRDIANMPAPDCPRKMQEFLGMATYMSPFIQNLAHVSAPLRDLLKKDVDYIFTASHQKAFDEVKKLICEATTLRYFDPNKDTVVNVDASSRGLGAVLLQDDQPVAFASKSLSETERRYANIEREMLAVVFGCERFHTYVYGKFFTVESDHKPLEMISLKNLAAAPPRLQRMLLRVQQYDFKLRYKPGKEMAVSDALSRSPCANSTSIHLDVAVHPVQFSTQKLLELRDEVSKDTELQALKEYIVTGWPERQRDLPVAMRDYWSYRDELTVEDGLLMKGNCVIIPVSLRAEVLKKLHASHQGIEKTRLLSRTCVFWNKIGSDIEIELAKCPVCPPRQKKQRSEPLLPHELPTRPWEFLGTDLFELDGCEYLVLSDYYSKFPIVRKIRGRVTSQAIINHLKCIMSEHGIPETIYCDNGGQFDSSWFRNFAEKWGFNVVTSSPHFPQSNGFAESQVKSVKSTLAKAKAANIDPEMALLVLRCTPVDSHLPSPAELLNARRFKANLPIRVRNDARDRVDVQNRLIARQLTQKKYFDQKAGNDLPELRVGQPVIIRHESKGLWQPANVSKVRSEPRSYEVETLDGKTLRRNRVHIRTDMRPEVVREKHVHFDPEILCETDDDMSNSNPPTVLKSPSHSNDVTGTYVTRSGRCVKPIARLDL